MLRVAALFAFMIALGGCVDHGTSVERAQERGYCFKTERRVVWAMTGVGAVRYWSRIIADVCVD